MGWCMSAAQVRAVVERVGVVVDLVGGDMQMIC